MWYADIMQIERVITPQIITQVHNSRKAIVIYGPRQVGKTTLCRTLTKQLGPKTLWINADEGRYMEVLSSQDSKKLHELVHGYELLIIDEAQRIPNIGINLKILIDTLPELKIIATGSSSFELANIIAEPLTGRKWTYQLYPIAQLELTSLLNSFELKGQLEERLIWGSYPELFQLTGWKEKRIYMAELTSDYLYKDILALEGLRYPDKLKKLLKLLAFQIGNEVSLHEVGTQLNMAKETVARYLDLLEKTFILFRLTGFSRNLRKEVAKMHKYYFCDVGIRNHLIDNFKPLSERNDLGQLWENFLIMERVKKNHYNRRFITPYFWRTYTGAEIDYVEEGENQLVGFELTWNSKKKRSPHTWQEEYGGTWELIHRDNWLDFAVV